MDANRRPSQGALRSPGDGFQEECVQPGKFPAVRSARDADTSFSTQPGPEAADGQWAEHVRSAPVLQTSTCSAIAKASSTSMPRYLTVLSILVWPSRSW